MADKRDLIDCFGECDDCRGKGRYVGLIEWGDYIPPGQRVCLCQPCLAARNETRQAAGEKPFCPIAYTLFAEEIAFAAAAIRATKTEREFRQNAGLDPDATWTAPDYSSILSRHFNGMVM